MRIDLLRCALKTQAMQFKNPRGARWAKWAVWSLVGLVAVWGLAWLAVPPLLKRAIEKSATQQLGRAVQVAQVDFRPWTLELTLHGLRVASAAGDAAQLQVSRIYIDAELQSLLRLAPVVDAVEVDAPQLRVAHLGAGRYDVDDILARLQQPPASAPADPQRFALYNLVLKGGSVDYTDADVKRTHALRELNLGIPFLSNLNAHRDVQVQPQLAFVLNGSRFDTAAEGTPFTQSRKTDATLRIAGFDLAPYLGYLPASLPVRLQAAVLDADLRLAFEQSPAPVVKLSGNLTARGARLATADAAPLLGFDTLSVQLDDVRPLERVARIQSVEMTGPRVDIRRSAQGRLNLDMGAGAAAGTQPIATTTQPAWNVSVQRLAVRDGVAAFDDQSTSPRATVTLAGVMLDVSAIQWPLVQPLQFSGSANVASRPPQASLTFAGSATAGAASATVTVSRLALGVAAPYLSQYLRPSLTGSLSTQLGVAWQAAAPGGVHGLQLLISSLTLDALNLADGGAPALASVRQLSLTDARVDLARNTVTVGKLTIEQPRVSASRDAQGRWMAQAWLKPQPSPEGQAAAAQPGDPWRVTLDSLAVNGGQLGWRESRHRRPVRPDQRQGVFLGPFRQAQLLGQPERTDRQAQRVLVGGLPQGQPPTSWPTWSCAGRAEGRRPRWRSWASSTRWPAPGAGHQGHRARPGAAAAVAVFHQVRRPRHRARQAQRGRGLPGAAQRAADGQQQGGAQPADLWRQGGGRAGQPAGEAGRGAAGRPQRRDRHQPADQRLAERPAVPLGPIIFKVIVNLVVKAITAPFSLLASAFGGGGDELSTVAFAPGSATLLAQAREGLDKVAKALNDRPALKMTVVGTASLEAEREAYKQERLRALLVAEKRRSMLAGNASAAEPAPRLTIDDAEVPVLLKEVYKRADITKPRNLAGLAQDIPQPEMEALLLANIAVTEDAIRELAVQRGVAVKDYLSGQKLPVERLFLGAVKPVANDPKWSPRRS
jgi:uncharacterized protein involved in outer membrane biogenesis/outer membrane protein OmpA-like peptidoglycan-associated protein